MAPYLRRVLVIVESFRPEQFWLRKAAQLARACDSALELCACDVEQYISASWASDTGEAQYRAALRARRLEDLGQLARPLRTGLEVTADRLLTAPLEHSLVRHVSATVPDLIVKSAHHPGVPVSALLQTDWSLARGLTTPVLFMGDRPWPQSPLIAAVGACETLAQPLSQALAGRLEQAPASSNTVEPLLDFLHRRDAAMALLDMSVPPAADLAARLLEQLDCDVLIVPPPSP